MTPCLLVATDGRPRACGALRMAQRLAERAGARVCVVAVYEPVELDGLGVTGLPARSIADGTKALETRVREQLAGLGPAAEGWSVVVEAGPVAPTIARVARARRAGHILLGLRRPGAVEHWLARETLFRLAHLAHVPVLAVAEEAAGLPRRVVVTTDFGDSSRRVAREALGCAAPDAQLHLVHVTWHAPDEGGRPEPAEWVRTYRTGVQHRLAEQAAELERGGAARVTTHVREGAPGSEILQLADELGADLIATGSHGVGMVGRLVLGSVASKLVHGARCSLLVIPAPGPAEDLLELSERDLLADLGNAAELALRGEGRP